MKKKEDYLELIIDYFLTSPVEELLIMPLKEFTQMIELLPKNNMFKAMCISLMDDLIIAEQYEKCSILKKFIDKVKPAI